MGWEPTEDGPRYPVWVDDPDEMKQVKPYCLNCIEQQAINEMLERRNAELQEQTMQLADKVWRLQQMAETNRDEEMSNLKNQAIQSLTTEFHFGD